MSVLCIDAGNTRLKWGLRESGRWLAQDALPTERADRLGDQLPQAPSRILACNVAGGGVTAAVEALAARLGVPFAWLRAKAAECGVANRYDDPSQLGADRWAALIGAHALHAGPCVIVNAGTATTIDLLDADGVFQGGMILPGLDMMRAALAGRTAGLPLARGEFRDLPRNTDDAIVSGAINATLGAIERMYSRIAAAPDALCLVSGGAVDVVADALELPTRRFPHLVLEGLACVAEAS